MGILKLRGDFVEWRLVDDEVIALDLRTSRYLGLNPTAALLWQHIIDGATEQALVDRLTGEYEVDRDQAKADVRGFIEDLTARGLLVSDPEATDAD